MSREPATDHYRSTPSLRNVGERTRLRVAGITVLERRRRPSGEPPALPRDVDRTLIFWLVFGGTVAALGVLAALYDGAADFWGNADDVILEWFEGIRSEAVTPSMEALDALGSEWTNRVLRWGMVVILAVYVRWRQLLVGLAAIFTVGFVVERIAMEVARAQPSTVEIIGSPQAFQHPSLPVAALTITLVVAGYALVPKSRLRNWWFAASAIVVALLGLARAYLALDHPTDVVVAAVLGVAVGVAAFRLFVPAAVFPVTYQRRRTAHLDLRDVRRAAIHDAVQEQLLDTESRQNVALRQAMRRQLGCELVGCDLVDLEHYGLDRSAGSTPLRMRVAGNPDAYLFAKLYAINHLRSDRWYKAARSMIYGALEDEVPFGSVRRLVEYEDYMLRVMHDAGLAVPQPYGFVEVIPRREYLLVTEFIDDAREISDVDITEPIIHNALAVIRHMWDAGLAHRDIKPANLLVRGDEVYLIDVAFAMVRPTPWRQAVDLANMMLLLAVQTDAETVYEHAVQHFDPLDIAEALAATRGVTVPRQLRDALHERRRRDGRDLLADFKQLAPDRQPIRIQRWSARRLATAALVLGGGAGFSLLLFDNLRGANFF